ncbi:4Fe-4S dicluster protein [Desulfitobacterium sp. LBE]|nr:4Fe-4S dicluster protein [Desulfitobacterium sp. LBE]
MSQYGFYFDMTSCIGCRTCQVSCKDKNDLNVGTLFRQVKAFETGSYPKPGIFHYSGTCNHCENPKCVEGCPTQALHKLENGIVDHDKAKCIGCRYCTWNCPYGSPNSSPNWDKSANATCARISSKQGKTLSVWMPALCAPSNGGTWTNSRPNMGTASANCPSCLLRPSPSPLS